MLMDGIRMFLRETWIRKSEIVEVLTALTPSKFQKPDKSWRSSAASNAIALNSFPFMQLSNCSDVFSVSGWISLAFDWCWWSILFMRFVCHGDFLLLVDCYAQIETSLGMLVYQSTFLHLRPNSKIVNWISLMWCSAVCLIKSYMLIKSVSTKCSSI